MNVVLLLWHAVLNGATFFSFVVFYGSLGGSIVSLEITKLVAQQTDTG